MITGDIVILRPAAQNVPPGISLPAGPAGRPGKDGAPGQQGPQGVPGPTQDISGKFDKAGGPLSGPMSTPFITLTGSGTTGDVSDTKASGLRLGSKLPERKSILDTAGVNNAATADSTAAVNTGLAAMKAVGGRMVLPAGKYLSSGWLLDNSGQTADVPDDSRQVSIEGDGLGNTVIYANTPSTYGVKVLGGLAGAANALNYNPIAGFTIARRTQPRIGSRGLWLSATAFARIRDVYLTDLEQPLYLESVLSSVFENLLIAASTNGISIAKGNGFSNSNNNTFNNPQLRLIDKVAVSGGPVTAMTVNGLGMQGIGTMGDATTGGMNLTFNGDAEGASGLTVNGGYVENNAGDADFTLTNTGSREVTHVFIGVTFSRLSAAKYVRTHFKLVGKNKVICIGCAFAAYNDYVVDASRPIVDYDPTQSTFQCIGCSGLGKADGVGITNGPRRIYRGFVAADGTLTQLEGSGLTVTKVGTGDYAINHGFGDTFSWTVQATGTSTSSANVQRVVRGNSTAEVITTAPSGTLTDSSFTYELLRY